MTFHEVVSFEFRFLTRVAAVPKNYAGLRSTQSFNVVAFHYDSYYRGWGEVIW